MSIEPIGHDRFDMLAAAAVSQIARALGADAAAIDDIGQSVRRYLPINQIEEKVLMPEEAEAIKKAANDVGYGRKTGDGYSGLGGTNHGCEVPLGRHRGGDQEKRFIDPSIICGPEFGEAVLGDATAKGG